MVESGAQKRAKKRRLEEGARKGAGTLFQCGLQAPTSSAGATHTSRSTAATPSRSDGATPTTYNNDLTSALEVEILNINICFSDNNDSENKLERMKLLNEIIIAKLEEVFP